MAVEDRAFFEHHGVSLKGMSRALLANLRAGGTVQGGSTLTQQLAKSYFLTAQRSLWRKLNDVLIALILEARYSKEDILEAYLNEVYLGQHGPRAVHGFGLAARHYFDRRLDELTLTETALLAAMVKGPSYYNPRRHPKRALERRNLVLSQMQGLGIITEDQKRKASKTPLGITRRPGQAGSRYPAFLDLVRRQLRNDYRDDDLQSEGLRVFTTLDPGVQEATRSALETTLKRLESSPGTRREGLQGAAVVTDSQSAEVLAMVGGRGDRAGGFNRAMDARRPIGSLVKPVVYLTALSSPARYHLASSISDEPVRLKGARGEPWEPKNYDGTTHGQVALMQALAHSYNLATVRLGMDMGLENVRDQLLRMGVERSVKPFPSLLLGAVEFSPLEVAGVYQTLAGGGFRQPLRAIRDVTDATGRPLERYGIDVKEAADTRANYLTVRAMQEVMRSGTGRSARIPGSLGAAGKTGTTDDLRDSWFAGFAGDRLAVVWVGRDDNRSARLTGASGALRVWTRLFQAIPVRPLSLEPPEGILWGYPLPDEDGAVRMVCAPEGPDRLPYIATDGNDHDCSGAAPAPAAANPEPAPRSATSRMIRRAEEAN
jgi:penicillin-binding protein 1B